MYFDIFVPAQRVLIFAILAMFSKGVKIPLIDISCGFIKCPTWRRSWGCEVRGSNAGEKWMERDKVGSPDHLGDLPLMGYRIPCSRVIFFSGLNPGFAQRLAKRCQDSGFQFPELFWPLCFP